MRGEKMVVVVVVVVVAAVVNFFFFCMCRWGWVEGRELARKSAMGLLLL